MSSECKGDQGREVITFIKIKMADKFKILITGGKTFKDKMIISFIDQSKLEI